MISLNEYDITAAFKAIENELIASMIRNMDRHRAEETKEGIEWSMWQAEQLKALEKYKRDNQKKYKKQFRSINREIEALIRQARETGNMEQELEILAAIKAGLKGAKKASPGATAEFFRLNDRKLEALIEATTHDMERAEVAVLRKADDDYRKAIYNAQVYANTGAGTYEKAVDMATKDMLSRGLNCIVYANGARHTLADYADMAIRTASKRAYLQGEGEKRQEWGIATVIVNKRGNPCPKCLPFCGKVLIDDVWSGGSRKDGKYPLMSTAIAHGLYHPRCKDSHTTYFPGISTADDTWTKEELEAIGEMNQQEAKQQYAERQVEKFERLEKHSLDADNRKQYKQKAESWKQAANEKDGFIPAKTLEEAQLFAEKYCRESLMDKTFKGKADFKGISLDHANEISEALLEIYENYDFPKITGIKTVDPNSTKGKKLFSSSDAVMAYSPVEHGIYINKSILKNKDTLAAYNKRSEDAWNLVIENMDKLSGSQRKLAERYKTAGRDLVGNGTAKDYFMHELGHHAQWEAFDGKTNNAVGARMQQYAGKLSGYATANKSEYFAESFVAYMKGERELLDPEYVVFLDKKFIAKASGSGIIDLSDAKEVTDVHFVGRIDRNIYKCVTEDIRTDEVIITDNQIQHIKDRHPNDYERFSKYFTEIVENPDYIIESPKPNTALILKEIVQADETFKTVVRLATTGDNPEYKNSIITFMKIDMKEWNRLLRNKKILYKKE